jgi:hypothetical protein
VVVFQILTIDGGENVVKKVSYINDNSEIIKAPFIKTFAIPKKPFVFEGIATLISNIDKSIHECSFSVPYVPNSNSNPIVIPTECTSFEIVVNPNVSTIVRGTEIVLSTKGCNSDDKNFGTVSFHQGLRYETLMALV